jgi:serine/threonine protein kinase
MEVQALAALGMKVNFLLVFVFLLNIFFNKVYHLCFLGSHENVVGYYSSWFENEQLYIQMELCDQSLSISRSSQLFTEGEVLQVLHQVMFFLEHFVYLQLKLSS